MSTVSIAEIEEGKLFIKGIPATENDVKEGRAVFFVDPGGNPIDMDIPQYAWHIDNETKQSTLWIIVQAEEQGGVRVFGAVDPETGGNFAGLDNEFLLIGRKLPG
ncbi:MAG: hypothetical protein AB199_01480 [Parcubacteria bacterium C7867-004]|nr:MAG: hypothetical protein AB199_01480 [Parcubacteria bacterium C7867-004]